MSSAGFYSAIVAIRDALEINPIGSVFERPGEIAPLPPRIAAIEVRKLRDKPSSGVNKGPVNKDAFFNLLEAKAYFLRLPKPVVKVAKNSSLVSISEELPGLPKEDPPRPAPAGAPAGEVAISDIKADAVRHKTGGNIDGVTMHVPAACESLFQVGRGLGRPATGPIPRCDPKEFAVLELLYHEMTHTWLYLQEFSDQGIKNLFKDGLAAYKKPKDSDGHEIPKPDGLDIDEAAFHEAAADYVQVRVSRWYTAVCGLAKLLRATPRLDEAKVSLQKIVEAYDLTRLQYGTIKGKKIVEPELPDDLRVAINEKILDGRPLTKPFNATPLADLGDAVLKKAKK
jgi:hypothetical protein